MVAPVVAAGSTGSTGEENEFGSIRAPFQVKVNGEPVTIEAKVKIDTMYEEQKATWYMFALDTQDSPAVDATLEAVETADGALKVSEVQGTGTDLVKWFVDSSDMPAPGTEITMRFTVAVGSTGFFSVGAMVVPFTYKWEEVKMSDGNQAKLYGFTQLGVNKATSSGGGNKSGFGAPGGGKLPVPGFEVAALLAAAAVGAVAVGARRRAR